MLTAKRVDELIRLCMFTPSLMQTKTHFIPVTSIIANLGFVPDAIEEHHEEIRDLLLELPDEFRADNEHGGWSFLNACNDKHGNHWGEHTDMDKLFSLGQAAGYCKLCLPRSLWPILPGGMPYFSISKERDKPEMLEITDELRQYNEAQIN